MRRVTAQIRHQRRRSGDDIQLANLMRGGAQLALRERQVRNFDDEVVSLAQLRHQRRKEGPDLQLAHAFPNDQRLLRIRRRGGQTTTLGQAYPHDNRLLRLRKEEGGGDTRLARLFPRSHVLTKAVGQSTTVRWDCLNNGDASGLCSMILIDLTDSKQVSDRRNVNVPAGGQASMILQWTVPSGFSGSHDMLVTIYDATTNNLRTLSSHRWTLSGSGGGGQPNLVASTASGQPLIL